MHAPQRLLSWAAGNKGEEAHVIGEELAGTAVLAGTEGDKIEPIFPLLVNVLHSTTNMKHQTRVSRREMYVHSIAPV
jgi:hypothetical protein